MRVTKYLNTEDGCTTYTCSFNISGERENVLVSAIKKAISRSVKIITKEALKAFETSDEPFSRDVMGLLLTEFDKLHIDLEPNERDFILVNLGRAEEVVQSKAQHAVILAQKMQQGSRSHVSNGNPGAALLAALMAARSGSGNGEGRSPEDFARFLEGLREKIGQHVDEHLAEDRKRRGQSNK